MVRLFMVFDVALTILPVFDQAMQHLRMGVNLEARSQIC